MLVTTVSSHPVLEESVDSERWFCIMIKIDFVTLETKVNSLYESFGMPFEWGRLAEATEAVDALIRASGWTPGEFDDELALVLRQRAEDYRINNPFPSV